MLTEDLIPVRRHRSKVVYLSNGRVAWPAPARAISDLFRNGTYKTPRGWHVMCREPSPKRGWSVDANGSFVRMLKSPKAVRRGKGKKK